MHYHPAAIPTFLLLAGLLSPCSALNAWDQIALIPHYAAEQTPAWLRPISNRISDYWKPQPAERFLWSSIVPSETFDFKPCGPDFKCARLRVPLDWNATDPSSDDRTVAVAVVKLPAKVPVTDPRYAGPIFLNPGGPGGSGTQWTFEAARPIQKLVDSPFDPDDPKASSDARYFDVIGFDPRGVNATTPFHTCISDPNDAASWSARDMLTPGTPEYFFDFHWAAWQAYGATCANETRSPIVNHLTTPNTVRDMVEMLERHGQWRQRETERLLGSSQSRNQDVFERNRHRKGEELMQYWGVSYGTLLGATFTALQPHRAHRMVLDAVVDPDDYYDGGWLSNLQDTDKVMDDFFKNCALAGPSNCSFADTGSTVASLQKKWRDVERGLEKNGPLPVPETPAGSPEVIQLSDLRLLVRMATYFPMSKFEEMSDMMAGLANGNGSKIAAWKHKMKGASPEMELECEEKINPHLPQCNTKGRNWQWAQAILCSDASSKAYSTDKQVFKDYLQRLEEQSKWMGPAWSTIRMMCSGWKATPGWKVTGSDIKSSETRGPVLLVGNQHDNVTPLRNAVKVQKRFSGSRVLEVVIDGHSGFANPSVCAGRAIRAYFQTGELPPEGTRCLPQERPFVGSKGDEVEHLDEPLSHATRTIVEALAEMKEVVGNM